MQAAAIYVAIWITRVVYVLAVVTLVILALGGAITIFASLVTSSGQVFAKVAHLYSSESFQDNTFIVIVLASVVWMIALAEGDIRNLDWRALQHTSVSDAWRLLVPAARRDFFLRFRRQPPPTSP